MTSATNLRRPGPAPTVTVDQVVAALRTYCIEYGQSPTSSLLARVLGCAQKTAERRLNEANEQGRVEHTTNQRDWWPTGLPRP